METQETVRTLMTLTGGVSLEERKFQWKILNFDMIVNSEELLTQQKVEFQFVNSNGIISAWKAYLKCAAISSSKTTDTKSPGKAVQLHVSLIEKEGCCSEILAQVFAKVEDKAGKFLFNGTPGKGDQSFKHKKNQDRYWKIFEVTPEKKLELDGGTLVINITVKFFSTISDPSFEVDVETIRANRKQQLYQNIGMLLNDQKHSDVKIVSSDGQKFFAYRWALTGASEVFEAMFRSNMKENKTGILKIEDVSGKTLKLLLHFIYTGNVGDEWSQPEIVEELIYAAEKYQIKDLKDFLDGSLGRICTVENAGNLLVLAKKTSMQKAEADILTFIRGKSVECDGFFDIVKNIKMN